MTPSWLLLVHLAVPAALLALGHRYRDLQKGSRRLFWGGVVGYVLSIAAVTALLVTPPVFWGSDGTLRWAGIVWTPLVLPVATAVGFRLVGGRGGSGTRS